MTTKTAKFRADDFIIPQDSIYPDGALRVKSFTKGILRAFPDGGGPVYAFPKEALDKYKFRIVTKEERDAVPFTKGKFGLDEGPDYDGWSDGRRWNGWAMPYFEKEVVKQILKDLGGRWDEETGVGFMPDETGSFVSADSGDACLVEKCELKIEGKEVWTFDGWCWNKA
jgi:hypothetical protein